MPMFHIWMGEGNTGFPEPSRIEAHYYGEHPGENFEDACAKYFLEGAGRINHQGESYYNKESNTYYGLILVQTRGAAKCGYGFGEP